MKKIVFLFGVMFLSLNIMAQLNGDANWNTTPVFMDDFNTSGRSWNDQFIDLPLKKWHAYYYGTGVMHGNAEHQVFQRRQNHFDANSGTMKIAADFISYTPMTCSDFELPDNGWLECNDGSLVNNSMWLHYYSGAIETNRAFRYGYFEIRCKLPIHSGAFPAFWLFRAGEPNEHYYEEIDIFEFSWELHNQHISDYLQPIASDRIFTNGSIFCNDCDTIGVTCGRKNMEVPSNTSLDSWNTFGCEWSPHRIVYYLNGEVVNEYYNNDSVPYRPMTLIANYALDNYCIDVVHEGGGDRDYSIPHPEYFPDTMYIDYIKVNQLKCDCDDYVTLYDNDDVNNYVYSVKKSINFMPSSSITIASNPKMVFRATDEIILDSGLEIQQGQEMELIIHPCPDYAIRDEEITTFKHKIMQR